MDSIYSKKTVSGSVDTERETIHISDNQKKILSVDTLTDGLGADLLISNYRYQYDNHLGSACLELDENAAIISYEEYHPFGTTSYRSGKTETEVSRKRYKYVGKERDEETGLYYYGARYYAVWVARFVSIDPLQHKYPYYTPFQYTGNKPVTYIDLDGLEELKFNALIPDLTPGQMDVGYRVYNPPADNTNMTSTPNNFRLLTSADLLVGSITPKEQPIVGPYNPTGMNEDYLKAVDRKMKMQVLFEERLNEQQNRSPLMFGNPGQPHGAGLYSSLEKGYEIGSAIEGGYGVYKLGVGIIKASMGFLASNSKNIYNVGKWLSKVDDVSEIPYGCEKVADKAVKELGEGAEYLQITPNYGNQLGPVNGSNSGWNWHVAAIKNNKVYNKLTGNKGLELDEYKKLFEYSDDLSFEIVKTRTLK